MLYDPPVSVLVHVVRGVFGRGFAPQLKVTGTLAEVSRKTCPVGVPEVALTFPVMLPDTDAAVPEIELGLMVTVVAVPVTAGVVHLLMRLVTFTEPRPVAKS